MVLISFISFAFLLFECLKYFILQVPASLRLSALFLFDDVSITKHQSQICHRGLGAKPAKPGENGQDHAQEKRTTNSRSVPEKPFQNIQSGLLGGLWDNRWFSILVSDTSKENSQVNVEEALRMNNQRRKQLTNIAARIGRITVPADIDELESIKSEIEDVLWDEQMAFDNMPESLQDSMRGEMSQDAQSNMEDAISRIDDFIADYENEADNKDRSDHTDFGSVCLGPVFICAHLLLDSRNVLSSPFPWPMRPGIFTAHVLSLHLFEQGRGFEDLNKDGPLLCCEFLRGNL